MSNSIKELREQVQPISHRIHSFKALIKKPDTVQQKKYQKELKQLQCQALFYIPGKIHNLEMTNLKISSCKIRRCLI